MTLPPAAMQVIILGSGTGVPSLTRSACAVLVTTGAQRILLDLGPGTLRRLLESGHQPEQIDHIFLSHFHPDHSAELSAFLFASNYPADRRRRRPLHLAGGCGMADFFERLLALYGHWVKLEAPLFRLTEWPPQAGGPVRQADVEIRTTPVAHNPESVAIRITDAAGCALVYSGDTGPCDGLVDLARGADLFICEAAIPAGRQCPNHLTPAQAGRIAERAGVGHLVLTHFYPDCDRADTAADARRTWSGPLTLATDLLRLPVLADRGRSSLGMTSP